MEKKGVKEKQFDEISDETEEGVDGIDELFEGLTSSDNS